MGSWFFVLGSRALLLASTLTLIQHCFGRAHLSQIPR